MKSISIEGQKLTIDNNNWNMVYRLLHIYENMYRTHVYEKEGNEVELKQLQFDKTTTSIRMDECTRIYDRARCTYEDVNWNYLLYAYHLYNKLIQLVYLCSVAVNNF